MNQLDAIAAATQVGPDAGSPASYGTAALYLGVYAWRWARCRRDPKLRSPSVGRLISFTGACVLFGAALGPPIDSWAEQSATMHMVQHVILLDLVPILLFAGLTKAILRPLTRRTVGLEAKVGWLALPVFAVFAYVGLMYFWHFPFAYDAALKNSGIHSLEHVSLMIAGLLYWWHLISPVRIRTNLKATGPALYMAATKILVGLLGIVLTFSPKALYAYTGVFMGMDPLVDQHVAGLTMATEQTIVMGIAFAILFYTMLGRTEREQKRAEQYGDPQAGRQPIDP